MSFQLLTEWRPVCEHQLQHRWRVCNYPHGNIVQTYDLRCFPFVGRLKHLHLDGRLMRYASRYRDQCICAPMSQCRGFQLWYRRVRLLPMQVLELHHALRGSKKLSTRCLQQVSFRGSFLLQWATQFLAINLKSQAIGSQQFVRFSWERRLISQEYYRWAWQGIVMQSLLFS